MLSAASTPAVAAEFLALGDLPGSRADSIALAISGDGSSVVGASRRPRNIVNESFRWDAVSGLIVLGDLPGGEYSGSALGVSHDGSVVVGVSAGASGGEAFIWDVERGIRGLGEPPGGAFFSVASAVSDDGGTAVGYGVTELGVEALVWCSDGTLQRLGDFPGGPVTSAATAVSADGSVVVGSGHGDKHQRGFIWDREHGMRNLGDVTGDYRTLFALGMAPDASAIVGAGDRFAGTFEAFVWTESGGMRWLEDLPGGTFYSLARDVSADGSVVIGDASIAGGHQAMIWDLEGGMRTIADELAALGATVPEGWTLKAAHAISDDGRIVVGTGVNPKLREEGWIAILAEPDASGLAAQKRDGLHRDVDGDARVDGGDSIRYAVGIENVGTTDVETVRFLDSLDANAPLEPGTVRTTQGIIVRGNGPNDASVEIDIGAIPPGAVVTVTFDALVADPLPEGVTSISNQGTATAADLPDVVTDDPDTILPGDPTLTQVVSELQACREDLAISHADLMSCLIDPPFEDADGDGEHDDTDACPETPADQPVDQAGCSKAEFCARFALSGPGPTASSCNLADWGNDEPLGAKDCRPRNELCEPR